MKSFAWIAAFLGIVAFDFAVAAAAEEPIQEIIVTAERYRSTLKLLKQTVKPSGDKMATWQVPICVSVKGFDAPQTQTVVAYIHEVARRVGATIAKPGCTPNVAITLVADGDVAARDLLDNKQFMLGDRTQQMLTDMARLGQAVRWVHLDRQTTIDGTSATTTTESFDSNSGLPGVPTVRSYGFASRNRSLSRIQLQRVIAIVDSRFTQGVSLRQLSAYLAMGSLLRLSRDADQVEAASILTLFRDRQAGRAAPTDLTDYDRALLQALYSVRNDLNGDQQYSSVTNAVAIALRSNEEAFTSR